MLLKVKTTKEGVLQPLKKINLPNGLELIISFEIPKKTTPNDFELISKKTFGILKNENWIKLRKSFNKDIDSRINKLWHVSS